MPTKPQGTEGKPCPDPKNPGPIAAAAAFLILSVTIGAVAFAATGGPPAEIVEAEAAAFAEADANDDGFLTEAELATFHTLMRAKIEAHRFDRADSNDDGLVTLEELRAARPGGPPCGGRGGHGGHRSRGDRRGAGSDVPVH